MTRLHIIFVFKQPITKKNTDINVDALTVSVCGVCHQIESVTSYQTFRVSDKITQNVTKINIDCACERLF